MLPNYICIGAMKAGSTSMHKYLTGSSNVTPCLRKEPQFFNYNWHRGMQWYENFFFEVEGRKTGEASPCYLFHPSVPARIKECVPDARILAILRNPVDRAYSQYQHFLRQDTTTMPTFEEELSLELRFWDDAYKRVFETGNDRDRAHQKWSYLARSRYAEQLDRFVAVGLDVLAVNADKCFANDPETLKAICNHVGIPLLEKFPHANDHSGYEDMKLDTREYLASYFAAYNQDLENRYGISW